MAKQNINKRDPEYIEGLGWEIDLTEENCSQEAWKALGGDQEISTEEFEDFYKEFLSYGKKV